MTDALRRSRVTFTIETLLGATAVSLAPLDPATLALAGGVLAARTLKYALDRERVDREHPLGLLYRVRADFRGTILLRTVDESASNLCLKDPGNARALRQGARACHAGGRGFESRRSRHGNTRILARVLASSRATSEVPSLTWATPLGHK
jgi:hypothetical protein